MSVALLLITHNLIGKELLDTAEIVLGSCPMRTAHLNVEQGSDPNEVVRRGLELLRGLDEGDGILILTDAFGSTPSNVAVRLSEDERIAVVAGINLPMLLRVLNYPELSLPELQDKALTGGRDGVLLVKTPRHNGHDPE